MIPRDPKNSKVTATKINTWGIVPLNLELISDYIKVGTASYRQHYLHLWVNRDPTNYLESSFTEKVVKSEIEDQNCSLFICKNGSENTGILKVIMHKELGSYTAAQCMYLEKIYLLAEHTGKGMGKWILARLEELAQENKKEVLCLDTMQKGPALHFYLKNGFTIIGEKKLSFPNVIDTERPMYILCKSLFPG